MGAWLAVTAAVRGGMPPHEFRVEPHVSGITALIDWIAACCRAAQVADECRLKMTLAIEEAVKNVIDHGFDERPPPHLIRVRLEITSDRVAAEVLDNGAPFDPTAAPEPELTLPLAQRRLGGLGIRLMRRIIDRVDYRRGESGNILRLEKARG